MALGLMTKKWRIFRSNLGCDLDRTLQIIRVAMKLHNYVINFDKLGLGKDVVDRDYGNINVFGVESLAGVGVPVTNRGYLAGGGRVPGRVYVESGVDWVEGDFLQEDVDPVEKVEGGAFWMEWDEHEDKKPAFGRRDAILSMIQEWDMERPDNNIRQNG
mmetsp:Transcript_43879/g.53113  ORF Transcript_43879/g.53113 Transcript_43879/m.53113 type:complete len:159 (+) Transcript_43879:156-632(+)